MKNEGRTVRIGSARKGRIRLTATDAAYVLSEMGRETTESGAAALQRYARSLSRRPPNPCAGKVGYSH